MKPNSLPAIDIEYRLARRDGRTMSDRTFPSPDYFYQPQADSLRGRAVRRPNERSRRAFRRMTTEMLARHERDEPMELLLMAFVTAIAAWPLADLLIVLAQTSIG